MIESMQERTVIKSAIHPRFIGGVAAGILVAVLGLILLFEGEVDERLPLVGWVLIPLAVLGVGAVMMTRRTQIVADESKITLVSWTKSESCDWKRLSALQFQRGEPGVDRATKLVAVNDMGRKAWEVPLHYFNREELRAWAKELPVRVQGTERL